MYCFFTNTNHYIAFVTRFPEPSGAVICAISHIHLHTRMAHLNPCRLVAVSLQYVLAGYGLLCIAISKRSMLTQTVIGE